jgi:hypothetical protein
MGTSYWLKILFLISLSCLFSDTFLILLFSLVPLFHDQIILYEKSMNDSTHGVAGHQSQPPQNQENHKNSPKHVCLLSRSAGLYFPQT